MLRELVMLRDMGYTHLRIAYSGGGDSGQIDEIDAQQIVDGKVVEENNLIDDEVEVSYEIIKDWVDSNLLNDIEDWWNNEGGYGEVLIDLSDLSYELDNNIYVTNTESFNHSGTLDLDKEGI